MFKFVSVVMGIVGVGGGAYSVVTGLLPLEISVAIFLGGIVLFIAAAMGAARFAPIAITAAAAAGIAYAILAWLETSGIMVPDIAKGIILLVCAFAVYSLSSFLVFAFLFIAAFFIMFLANSD